MALADYLAEGPLNSKSAVGRLSTDSMLDIAGEAASFASHAYWRRMAVMLNGTITAEFEEMLQGEGHPELNRAAIVVARKMLRMPFIDIEQGKAAVAAVDRVRSQSMGRPGSKR